MATIAELLNIKKSTSKEMAKVNESKFTVSASPKTETSSKEVGRVDPNELEAVYRRDPIAFNGINFIKKTCMATGYTLGPKESVSAKTLNFFQEWWQRNEGHRLVGDMVVYLCVYGNGYLEHLPPKRGKNRANRIAGIEMIDPSTIDFQKNSATKKIKTDKNGNPVGYVQKLDFYTDKVGEEWDKIKLDAKQVTHFKLYKIGNGFSGIGLIEPMYKSTHNKWNIEHAHAQSMYRVANPKYVAYVGDETHDPTVNEIDSLTNKLKKTSYSDVWGLPYYHKLAILEPQRPERMRETIELFINEQIAALGVPKPFVTGSGEDSRRATLSKQTEMFHKTVEEIQGQISYYFNKLFEKIAEGEGLKEYPLLIWNPVSVQDLDAKAKRIMMYAQTGMIPPTEQIQNAILKMEDLPLGGEKIKLPERKGVQKEPSKPKEERPEEEEKDDKTVKR